MGRRVIRLGDLPPAAFYSDDGSTTVLTGRGDHVTIRYHQPKSSLREHTGTHEAVPLRGQHAGRGLTGTAYVFRAGCKPAGRGVAGPAVARDIVLSAAAPVRPRGSCLVTG